MPPTPRPSFALAARTTSATAPKLIVVPSALRPVFQLPWFAHPNDRSIERRSSDIHCTSAPQNPQRNESELQFCNLNFGPSRVSCGSLSAVGALRSGGDPLTA
jgi:hypothetical protein